MGTAVLELASGSSAGVLAGFGTEVTNFTSLVFDTGAAWTVAGNDSANGLGTLGIGGFTINDTIDLTGFVATSRTFAGNTLTLTAGGGAHETLTFQGSLRDRQFRHRRRRQWRHRRHLYHCSRRSPARRRDSR